jgi:hypothetical protein
MVKSQLGNGYYYVNTIELGYGCDLSDYTLVRYNANIFSPLNLATRLEQQFDKKLSFNGLPLI